jgi:hypothetical protein
MTAMKRSHEIAVSVNTLDVRQATKNDRKNKLNMNKLFVFYHFDGNKKSADLSFIILRYSLKNIQSLSSFGNGFLVFAFTV